MVTTCGMSVEYESGKVPPAFGLTGQTSSASSSSCVLLGPAPCVLHGETMDDPSGVVWFARRSPRNDRRRAAMV